MTVKEAVEQGVTRIRRPEWKNADTYLKLDIIDGKLGPWMHLFARTEQEIMKLETPQDMLTIGQNLNKDKSVFEPYEGVIDTADTSKP